MGGGVVQRAHMESQAGQAGPGEPRQQGAAGCKSTTGVHIAGDNKKAQKESANGGYR